MSSSAVSEGSVSLHIERPLLLRVYGAPFGLVYAGAVWTAYQLYDEPDDQWEVALILMLGAALVHLLVALSTVWSVRLRCLLTCNPVTLQSMSQARLVCVIPARKEHGRAEMVPLDFDARRNRFSFVFQKIKHVWSTDESRFVPVRFETDRPVGSYCNTRGLRGADSIAETLALYGDNTFEIPMPTFRELFIEQATAPFFVFQMVTVGLWLLDEYWYFSLFTLMMLVVFESTVVMQRQRNIREFRQMRQRPYDVYVYRDERWTKIRSDQLLPGDLVSIVRLQDTTGVTAIGSDGEDDEDENAVSLPCDLLLLAGDCVVNEAMLTGESVPQMKEPLAAVATPEASEANPDNAQPTTTADASSAPSTEASDASPANASATAAGASSADVVTTMCAADQVPLDVTGLHRVHLLSGGTTVVQASSPTAAQLASSLGLRSAPPDRGSVAYVLRTGFHTNQGDLMRTILFSTERVTANSWETFGFIMFLLVFALVASHYVWTHGTTAKRTRYKLLLECILIITSVVPPELPMELSMAVNVSLIELAKQYIFCTEPFRIPFGGKIDVCCFDKTGTLTSNDLVIDGVAGVPDCSDTQLTGLANVPSETQSILACCQSLMMLDNAVVGDPLEKATLAALDWQLRPNSVAPRTGGKARSMAIVHRYHFTSALKRMSVIARSGSPAATPTRSDNYLICAKGAPEVIEKLLKEVPAQYEATHLHWARRGARVLSLAYRRVTGVLRHEVEALAREQVECDLVFAGFLVVSCPLKKDTAEVLKGLRKSSHHLVMITGDSPLTACHVAGEVSITSRPVLMLHQKSQSSSGEWEWETIAGDRRVPLDQSSDALRTLVSTFDLCVTGAGLTYLETLGGWDLLKRIVPHVRVYARVAPQQKQQIVHTLNELGFGTLMCGDGTNDVGALKQASVGVALLDGTPESLKRETVERQKVQARMRERQIAAQKTRWEAVRASGDAARQAALQEQANRMIQEASDMAQEVPVIKFGDASIASPFTSKLSSTMAVVRVIRQGRCTLVTTLQMFRILALNSLIMAYSLSVLYLDGIKPGDTQATVQGLLLAGCFLFVSRSKPLHKLSRQRPLTRVFSVYMLVTVLLQFAVHLSSLLLVMNEAKRLDGAPDPTAEDFDVEAEFTATTLNTSVFLISMWMHVCNFAINHEGHPFKESIMENRGLFYSLTATILVVLLATVGVADDLLEMMEMVQLPDTFRMYLLQVMAADFAVAYICDRTLRRFFGQGSFRKLE